MMLNQWGTIQSYAKYMNRYSNVSIDICLLELYIIYEQVLMYTDVHIMWEYTYKLPDK